MQNLINSKVAKKLLALVGTFAVAWILLSDGGDTNLRRPVDRAPGDFVEDGFYQRLLVNFEDFNDPKSVVPHSVTNVTNPTTSVVNEENYAIFLISFGEDAAESTYVERSILSIRRRGAFNGAVIVLTDAPDERYDDLFDKNVFVLHPKEVHIKYDYFKFGEMTFKRFKTYVTDYVDSVPELEKVEWIYYVDIDVLFGAPFMGLVSELEQLYNLKADYTDNEAEPSKLHFFENGWTRYALQGGFFIANRKSSRYCLELWREEIDARPDEKMDQETLDVIYNDFQSGKEKRCELVAMEKNDDHCSYPARDYDLLEIMRSPKLPYLIHIRNTYLRVHYRPGLHEEFVGEVLKLSDAEKEGNQFTKQTYFGATPKEME